ncbi:MAG: DUF3016 domain-containing protein [Verrucomicrobia bacterium]|nr:DUF3016 domain-containing protein [Verrucomicrobiota bacterium]
MRHYLIAAAFCACFAVWSTSLKASARVEYVHPESFTDVSFRSMTHEAAAARLERELTKTIQEAAAQYLSKYQLDVQIVDVAMAGREAFERPGFNADLRIRNQMGKPPKISVRYEIKDPRGHVIAKGTRVLTDLSYQLDYANSEIDALYPEKQLLRRWIRDLPR